LRSQFPSLCWPAPPRPSPGPPPASPFALANPHTLSSRRAISRRTPPRYSRTSLTLPIL
jgi:hypothetical protein